MTELSDVFAFIAVIVSLAVAYKSHRLSKSVAEAQAKPILTAYTTEYVNNKALTLTNAGVGTAVITKVRISRGETYKDTIADLFTFSRPLKWDTFWRFQQTRDYLQAGDRRTLVRLTQDNLVRQGYKPEDALSVLTNWQKQLNGISIAIEYQDVFGNPQDPYQRTFKSNGDIE